MGSHIPIKGHSGPTLKPFHLPIEGNYVPPVREGANVLQKGIRCLRFGWTRRNMDHLKDWRGYLIAKF